MVGGLDMHSNPMTGTSDAIQLYDRAIDRLIRFHPDVVELAGELTGDRDPAPMASALFAYLNLMSTDADDLSAARSSWEQLSQATTNERERAHAAAIGAWLDGDWHGASSQLDDLLTLWPTDVLALMLGHQLDFFLGDAANLRDRPIRSLRELAADDPHIDFVRGMASFGLEEAGQYGQALDAGLAAVHANPDDVWLIHAVVHTYDAAVDDGWLPDRRFDPVGERQPLHRPQLVASRALLPRGRTGGTIAGGLRRRAPPSWVCRGANRDARRIGVAVAVAAGRSRHRQSLRRVGGRVGAEDRCAVC
jgi:hypothetical protein